MIKVKVSEASDIVLDYMVALALGHNIVWDGIAYWISDLNTSKLIWSKWKSTGRPCGWSPSSYWEYGGPVIDQMAKGDLFFMENDGDSYHVAYSVGKHDNTHGQGPTPLIASMRCYVTSTLGDEVEVPDELVIKP